MTDATPTPGNQPGAFDPTTVQPAVPPTPPPPGTPGTGGSGGNGDNSKRNLIIALVVVGVLAAILLIVVLVMTLGGSDSKSSNTTTSSSTTSSSTTSSSTTTTTAKPASTSSSTTTTVNTKPTMVSLNVPTQVACPGTSEITVSWNYANTSKVTISIDGPGIYDTFAPIGTTQIPYSCAEVSHSYLFTATGPGGVTTDTRIVKRTP